MQGEVKISLEDYETLKSSKDTAGEEMKIVEASNSKLVETIKFTRRSFTAWARFLLSKLSKKKDAKFDEQLMQLVDEFNAAGTKAEIVTKREGDIVYLIPREREL